MKRNIVLGITLFALVLAFSACNYLPADVVVEEPEQTPTYVGDAPGVGALLMHMPEFDRGFVQNMFALQTQTQPFGLVIYFEPSEHWDGSGMALTGELAVYAEELFEKIDNLGYVEFAYRLTSSGGILDVSEYNVLLRWYRDSAEIEYNLALFEQELARYVASLPLDGVTSAGLQIRFAAHELFEHDSINELVDLDTLPDYRTFIEPGRQQQWEEGFRVVFTTHAPVEDFRIIGLTYGFFQDEPTDGIYVREVIYAAGALTPQMPLVASWVHEGCFTSGRGISFLYEGVVRYFEIVHSNKSGHLFLSELAAQD